jgi:hypothetical protein
VPYVEVGARIHGLDAATTRHQALRFTRELQELKGNPVFGDAGCVARPFEG